MITDIKGEIDNNTIIVGDSNTTFTSLDWLSIQKITKENQTLNGKLDQMDLIDIYRAFPPKASEYIFF